MSNPNIQILILHTCEWVIRGCKKGKFVYSLVFPFTYANINGINLNFFFHLSHENVDFLQLTLFCAIKKTFRDWGTAENAK